MATQRLARTIPRDLLGQAFPNNPRLVREMENIALDVAQNIPDSLDGNTEATEQAQADANEAKTKAESAQQGVNSLKVQPYILVAPSTDLPNSRALSSAAGIGLSSTSTNLIIRPANLLAALQNLTSVGFLSRTGTDAVSTREIKAGSTKVSVANGTGVGGDPTVDVNEANLTLNNLGGTLNLSKGGTGATTAAAARTNLGIAALVSATGDFKQRAATSFPAGWVRSDSGTIGNAASGATRSNADTQDLFTLWWTSYTDAQVPILTSTGDTSVRGASASADYTANKRMTVPVVADASPLIGAYKL